VRDFKNPAFLARLFLKKLLCARDFKNPAFLARLFLKKLLCVRDFLNPAFWHGFFLKSCFYYLKIVFINTISLEYKLFYV
jgi:hypothetical protein